MDILGLAARYLVAVFAAGIFLWCVSAQSHAAQASMGDTPNVATYATTHVCGTHVCTH